MKEIGGYFGLEYTNRFELHHGAIKLNTARNCLAYILKAKKYAKVYVPYYVCNAIIEILKKEKVDYAFYHIDQVLDPIINIKLKHDEALLYINYFGLKQKAIDVLAKKYKKGFIVDNAQAFFAKPIKKIDTFYSARKFFGVPDGAYLYTNNYLNKKLVDDISYDRTTHLLKRLDISAESAYKMYLKNEAYLGKQPVKKMSKLTQSLLGSIDYERVKLIREKNFLYYYSCFKHINNLKIDIHNLNGPMLYPLLISNNRIKDFLIMNKIFIATYWFSVLKYANINSFESKLVSNLIPLPVDQRYSLEECKYLGALIKKKLGGVS